MNSNRGIARDLTTGNLAKSLFVFSLPLMLANILQLAYNLVDVIGVISFLYFLSGKWKTKKLLSET